VSNVSDGPVTSEPFSPAQPQTSSQQ